MKTYSLRVPVWLGAVALLVMSCQKADDVVPPSTLIARDQMVALLMDLHTLEARTDAAGLPADSARALFRQEQKKLYARYQVTDSAFTLSYRYYAIHDKDLDQIYATVIDSLSAREAREQKAEAAKAK